MAIRDTWRRSLEYFGLVEGDYIEEGEYDEGDTGSERTLDDTAAPREPVRSSRRRGRDDDIDDIFGDEEAPRRSRISTVDDTAEEIVLFAGAQELRRVPLALDYENVQTIVP